MKQIATWIRACDENHFRRVFSAYPEVQLLNARTEKVVWDEVDALLLTGGSDISAPYLRQNVPDLRLIQDPDPQRDAWEFAALEKALLQKMPLLAICRGLQVLNVALGGTLHLDIPHHDDHKLINAQVLRYASDAKIQFPRVNSSHHQAIHQLGMGLVIEAWCVDDNTVEQIRLRDYPFALAAQYHPERDPLYAPFFQAFIDAIGDTL